MLLFLSVKRLLFFLFYLYVLTIDCIYKGSDWAFSVTGSHGANCALQVCRCITAHSSDSGLTHLSLLAHHFCMHHCSASACTPGSLGVCLLLHLKSDWIYDFHTLNICQRWKKYSYWAAQLFDIVLISQYRHVQLFSNLSQLNIC